MSDLTREKPAHAPMDQFRAESGELLQADHIVMAVSEEAAFRLLPQGAVNTPKPARSTTCLYFAASEADVPVKEPILHLDGDGRGPVNSAVVLSRIAPEYAPAGQHLISASIVGMPSSHELEEVVREQMTRWYGSYVQRWRHLRTVQVRHAQRRRIGPRGEHHRVHVEHGGQALDPDGAQIPHA